MYCATILLLLETYVLISSSPPELVVSNKGGYYYVPYDRCRGKYPKIRHTNLCWNPPNRRLIWGITTHVSDPNRKMAWTIVSYKRPNVLVYAPYLPNIKSIQYHLFLAFRRLDMTVGQSSPAAVRRRPRYLKDDTVYSERP